MSWGSYSSEEIDIGQVNKQKVCPVVMSSIQGKMRA